MIRASQKAGVEKPTNTNNVVNLSKREYCFTAERMPTGIAIKTIRTKERILIFSVTGIRSPILSATFLPSTKRTEVQFHKPFEPLNILDMQRLIETVKPLEIFPRLGRRLERHLGFNLYRTSGCKVNDDKGDERNPENKRYHRRKAFKNIQRHITNLMEYVSKVNHDINHTAIQTVKVSGANRRSPGNSSMRENVKQALCLSPQGEFSDCSERVFRTVRRAKAPTVGSERRGLVYCLNHSQSQAPAAIVALHLIRIAAVFIIYDQGFFYFHSGPGPLGSINKKHLCIRRCSGMNASHPFTSSPLSLIIFIISANRSGK